MVSPSVGWQKKVRQARVQMPTLGLLAFILKVRRAKETEMCLKCK